jgi:hypothetical protein
MIYKGGDRLCHDANRYHVRLVLASFRLLFANGGFTG